MRHVTRRLGAPTFGKIALKTPDKAGWALLIYLSVNCAFSGNFALFRTRLSELQKPETYSDSLGRLSKKGST